MFFQGPRFGHGSIYEGTAKHSKNAGPSSYNTVTADIKKPCQVVYHPIHMEQVTHCADKVFEMVNGSRVL